MGLGWPRQRFKGRGAGEGGRRPTSFFLGVGCPREFWSSERAGGCYRGISYHGRSYPGGGYINNDDIHTWENNVIGEGVGQTPPPSCCSYRDTGYIDNDISDKK